MGDMMPDDIPHTDDKAKRKSHPGAKASFFLSLVPLVLLACGYVVFLLDGFIERPYGFYLACFNAIPVLFLTSLWAQPLGILLGIYSLVQIRKNCSCCGKGYAITGIIISTLEFVVVIAIYWQ